MTIPAPYTSHRGVVQPGWADENFHMNLAYYLVLFDGGSDALFEVLGIGQAYRHAVNCTCFAAETHLVYEREMNLGETANIVTTVLDMDDRRLHIAHEMYRDGEAARICLQEIMFVNVNLGTRRAASWTADALDRLHAALALHNTLPRPAKLGRNIGIMRTSK